MEKPIIISADLDIDEIAEVVTNTANIKNFFSKLWDSLLGFLPTLVLALVVIIAGIIIAKIAQRIIKRVMGKAGVDRTASKFLRSLVRVAIYIFTFITALSVLGIPMTSIIAMVGAAGVAIALALQSSLTNIAGGFLILFAKPFKAGDKIESNGAVGEVDFITILYTRLTLEDGTTIFIPNGQVANSKLVNHGYEPPTDES